MKTTKAIPQLLAAVAVLFGTACSSTSSTTTGTTTPAETSSTGMGASTAGSQISTGTSMDASSAAAGTDLFAFSSSFATMTDPTFLMTAASSNMFEVEAGGMALRNSTNDEVKKFGQMMIDEHTKATQELQTVAAPLGVTLPQALMPIHQSMLARLVGKSGKEFDQAYMDLMETAHSMDVSMYEVKSKGAENSSVKSLAKKTLSTLRSHHTMADKLEEKID